MEGHQSYDEVVLVSSVEDSDVIYSLQTLMRRFQPEMFRALAKATTKGEVSVKELVKATAIEVAKVDTKAKAAKPKQDKPDRPKPRPESKGKPSWQDRSAKGDLPKLVTAGGKLMSSKQMDAAKAAGVCFDFMQGKPCRGGSKCKFVHEQVVMMAIVDMDD